MSGHEPTGRKLRIVHTESSDGWGGQERRILSESQGLIERGHQVRILCPDNSPILTATRQLGIPSEPLPITRVHARGLLALAGWLRDNRVDVINTHSSNDSWLASFAVRSLWSRPAVVRTRHIGAKVSRSLLTRWLYARGADLVVACGDKMRHNLVTYNGLAPEHICSVPTGIDTDHYAPADKQRARQLLGLAADKFIVGVVAVLRGGKGHRYLLRAVRQLPRDDVHVVIVGDGMHRGPIEENISQLGLGKQVVMAGHRDDVVTWLRAMDIFVLPSVSIEGVPQSIIQAMSCQLPVVATTVGSIPDAVSHEETGLLVPPRDPEALARCLDRLIRDEALRRRFGRRGRQVVKARFSVGGMLDKMEGVFRRAAA